MNLKSKPLVEITHQAITLLYRELGSADAIRFLNQFSNGQGDYTAEREHLFADLTADQLWSDIAGSPPGETPGPSPSSPDRS